PAYVLLGLNFDNFGPLKLFPKKYPPKSVKVHTIIINKKFVNPKCSLKRNAEYKEVNKKQIPKILRKIFFLFNLSHSLM
mgnify:CR=1